MRNRHAVLMPVLCGLSMLFVAPARAQAPAAPVPITAPAPVVAPAPVPVIITLDPDARAALDEQEAWKQVCAGQDLSPTSALAPAIRQAAAFKKVAPAPGTDPGVVAKMNEISMRAAEVLMNECRGLAEKPCSSCRVSPPPATPKAAPVKAKKKATPAEVTPAPATRKRTTRVEEPSRVSLKTPATTTVQSTEEQVGERSRFTKVTGLSLRAKEKLFQPPELAPPWAAKGFELRVGLLVGGGSLLGRAPAGSTTSGGNVAPAHWVGNDEQSSGSSQTSMSLLPGQKTGGYQLTAVGQAGPTVGVGYNFNLGLLELGPAIDITPIVVVSKGSSEPGVGVTGGLAARLGGDLMVNLTRFTTTDTAFLVGVGGGVVGTGIGPMYPLPLQSWQSSSMFGLGVGVEGGLRAKVRILNWLALSGEANVRPVEADWTVRGGQGSAWNPTTIGFDGGPEANLKFGVAFAIPDRLFPEKKADK
ncbi:MAG: hypothetical protein V1821_00845 [bacterium]